MVEKGRKGMIGRKERIGEKWEEVGRKEDRKREGKQIQDYRQYTANLYKRV